MNRRHFLTSAASAAGCCLFSFAATAAEEGWQRLYNGKDLSGWHAVQGDLSKWKANGEMITCTGRGGGCLATEKEYGDFELRLEYRVPTHGNTGVGIRFPRGGWPSTDGMEIQILDDDSPRYANLKPDHRNGSIYTHAAPLERAHKPAGEWNQYVIRAQGPHLVIHLNGVKIHDVNLDDFGNSFGKGTLPLAKRTRKGLIGFPSHGDPVDFRNIEIREL
ncbi:MAG: DUF1080 domain-containing protein [Armatimonadota bacterium]